MNYARTTALTAETDPAICNIAAYEQSKADYLNPPPSWRWSTDTEEQGKTHRVLADHQQGAIL